MELTDYWRGVYGELLREDLAQASESKNFRKITTISELLSHVRDKEFHLDGGYRLLSAVPKDLSVEFVNCKKILNSNNLNSRLRPLMEVPEFSEDDSESESCEIQISSQQSSTNSNSSDSMNLIVRFTLGSGEYATMCLRELTGGRAREFSFRPE